MPILVTAAVAAAAGRSIAVSPYLWAPGVSTAVATPFGTLDAKRSPGDVLSSADFALMGTVEARNGRLGLIADLVFANLSESNPTPFGTLFSRADVATDLRLASGFVAWRIHDAASVTVDLAAGFRATSLDLDVMLAPAALPGRVPRRAPRPAPRVGAPEPRDHPQPEPDREAGPRSARARNPSGWR